MSAISGSGKKKGGLGGLIRRSFWKKIIYLKNTNVKSIGYVDAFFYLYSFNS